MDRTTSKNEYISFSYHTNVRTTEKAQMTWRRGRRCDRHTHTHTQYTGLLMRNNNNIVVETRLARFVSRQRYYIAADEGETTTFFCLF